MTYRFSFCFLAIAVVAALMTISSQARSATVGLWLFEELEDTTPEELEDTTPDPTDGGGERTFDSSGNDLHFTKGSKEGLLALTSDVPSVAPADSMAVHYTSASSVDTPSTDLLSIGKTGQITIEFWYKPLSTYSTRRILAQENNYPDGELSSWNLAQRVGKSPSDRTDSLQFSTILSKKEGQTVPSQTFLRSKEEFLDESNSQWMHLAITVDNTHTARMYRDGMLLELAEPASNMGRGTGPYDPFTSTLRLGSSNPNDGNKGEFLMDDLRISDVALPSGNGTGVNELAWDTSLSTVSMAVLAGDANNDNQVTGGDLIAVQQNFGTIYLVWGDSNCDGMGLGDANDDCQVTGADLIAVQQNFGQIVSNSAMPEPATAMLLGGFIFVLGCRFADAQVYK